MRYTLDFTPRAAKSLADLPHPVQVQVARCLALLADEPRGVGVAKVTDAHPPVYRAKAGRDHRVVFAVDDGARQVLVVWVGHRKDAYRQR